MRFVALYFETYVQAQTYILSTPYNTEHTTSRTVPSLWCVKLQGLPRVRFFYLGIFFLQDLAITAIDGAFWTGTGLHGNFDVEYIK